MTSDAVLHNEIPCDSLTEFRQGSPDADMGAVVMDMTGLPDTTKVKEVARIRYPEHTGGFHEIYSYKHSDGRAMLFAQVSAPWANIYDMAKVVAGGDKAAGLIGTVPNPTSQEKGTNRGYHDMYVGYDPVSHQDRFFGAGGGGYYVYDVTNPAEAKLITSATGIAGLQNGHTFTPTPDGRYAVLESEYRYAPLRIIDLKPGYDGTVKTISRPIGAYTTRWDGLPHNHEVRWPYVFISHYEDGLRVINLMDPTNPYEVGFYDTYDGPIQLDKSHPFEPPTPGKGSEQDGADGIDVRNWDGMIAIGDLYTGVWLFKMDGFDGWNGHQWGMPNQSSRIGITGRTGRPRGRSAESLPPSPSVGQPRRPDRGLLRGPGRPGLVALELCAGGRDVPGAGGRQSAREDQQVQRVRSDGRQRADRRHESDGQRRDRDDRRRRAGPAGGMALYPHAPPEGIPPIGRAHPDRAAGRGRWGGGAGEDQYRAGVRTGGYRRRGQVP